MPGLLLAEQIARAPDVEIVTCQHEACAQRIEGLQNFQPLLGRGREARLGGDGEIGVGAHLGAAHAATQLIELSEAESVGAKDDERVGGRNVEAGFHDRGGEQHIVLAIVEGVHHLVELARWHLAVGARHFQLRHMLLQKSGRIVEVGNARHHEEGLPAAEAFPQQRLAQDHRIERRHIGAHRKPVDGRGGDQRHLAHARERKLQGPRDRRCRHGQHMHILAHLFQALLVGDAEMLLLVHDQESEIGERDAFAE